MNGHKHVAEGLAEGYCCFLCDAPVLRKYTMKKEENREEERQRRMLRRGRQWRVLLRIGAGLVLLLLLYSIVKKGWIWCCMPLFG